MFCVVFLKVKTNYQIELDQFCIKSMSSLTCCPSIKYHHSALQTTDLVCSRLQTGRLWRANNNWSIVWFRFVFFVSPLVQFRFLLLLCTGNANARHLGLLFCYISQSYIFPKHLLISYNFRNVYEIAFQTRLLFTPQIEDFSLSFSVVSNDRCCLDFLWLSLMRWSRIRNALIYKYTCYVSQ